MLTTNCTLFNLVGNSNKLHYNPTVIIIKIMHHMLTIVQCNMSLITDIVLRNIQYYWNGIECLGENSRGNSIVKFELRLYTNQDGIHQNIH